MTAATATKTLQATAIPFVLLMLLAATGCTCPSDLVYDEASSLCVIPGSGGEPESHPLDWLH
ncbi:MAG: hypothetical protein ACR2PJ_03635 [Pseudomonadales bacterium]